MVKEGSWEAKVGKGTKMKRHVRHLQRHVRHPPPSATPKETPKGGQGGPKMSIGRPIGGGKWTKIVPRRDGKVEDHTFGRHSRNIYFSPARIK